MARYTVAPTKTNLFRLKREELFAREGHQLLEQKREILMAELMTLTRSAQEAQERIDAALREAYDALRQATVRMGASRVTGCAMAVDLDAVIEVRYRQVMGVHVPIIGVTFSDHTPYYSLSGTSVWLDESVRRWRAVLQLLAQLAQLKITVYRLAAEVRRTTRRVNALEKIYLPDYRETIAYINDVLEEQAREAFFTLKLIKSRLTASGNGRPAP